MSAEHERRLLAHAEELDDTGEIAETVTGILGGARAARLDPDALGGLTGAALALGADSRAVYSAGSRGQAAVRLADDGEFVAAVADAEDDIAERLRAAGILRGETAAALDRGLADLAAARRELAAARAMPVSGPCRGCHAARAAAIAAAEARIRDCQERAALGQAALDTLGPLLARLRHALARIRAVPEDLGETYESVYRLLRRGGAMPFDGDWLTGPAARLAAG
jgi:hypothetical protein